MTRKDQFTVTVTVNWPGIPKNGDLGVFDQATGGEVDSNEVKYQPGGMAPQVSLGGSVVYNNVTVNVLYDPDVHGAYMGALFAAAGKAPMTIKKQTLDLNKNPTGQQFVYVGTLKQVIPPEHDSSSSDAALLGLEMSTSSVTAQ